MQAVRVDKEGQEEDLHLDRDGAVGGVGIVLTLLCQAGLDEAALQSWERALTLDLYPGAQVTRKVLSTTRSSARIPGHRSLKPALAAEAATEEQERGRLPPPRALALDFVVQGTVQVARLARALDAGSEAPAGPGGRVQSAERSRIRARLEVVFPPPPRHGAGSPGHAGHVVDFGLQADSVWRRCKRLVVFDMDSTLIQQEVIDELARDAGIGSEVASITDAAMRGELDFQQSLRKRVALLAGAPAALLDAVRARVTLSPGARELCHALRRLGIRMAVVSGGFLPLAQYVQAQLGLDHAFANELEVAEGKLTGGLCGEIVDAAKKGEHLVTLAERQGISLRHQTIAVGDGANDLVMMRRASVGIAFHAKPRVQEQADMTINQPSLLHVLHYLGYSDHDIAALLAEVEEGGPRCEASAQSPMP